MNIIILAQNATTYSTTRLIKAFEARNHSIQVVNPLLCTLNLDNILYDGKELQVPDVTLLRSASSTPTGKRISRPMEYYVATHFQLHGSLCINDPDKKRITVDKMQTLQRLYHAGVPVPPTIFARQSDEIADIVDMLGMPLIIKTVDGTQGKGVIRADSLGSARSVFDAMTEDMIFFQQYIREAVGQDIRVVVIGNEVVAAMRRTVVMEDEFRSNIHRGGKGEPIELADEYKQTAIDATQTLGLHIAGVDILETNKGPMVIEMNSSPSLETIEKTTSINLAGRIVAYIESTCSKL